MLFEQFSKHLGGLYSYHSPKQLFWKCLRNKNFKQCLHWNPEIQMRTFMNF